MKEPFEAEDLVVGDLVVGDLAAEELADLRRALETTAPRAGDHPEPADLALWIDGEGDRELRERIERHLADCAECRAVALDAAAGVPDDALQDVPSRAARSQSVRSQGASTPALRTFPGARRALGLLAAAAVVILMVSLRLLTVDPGLAEHGVSVWDRLTADRDLLSAAAEALAKDPAEIIPSLEFGAFAVDPSQTRGAEARVALLSPRWEAVPMGSTWRWTSDKEPVAIWVFDETERVVVHEAIDPRRLDRQGDLWTYSLEDAGLAPGGLYAWKINVENAQGELWDSSPVPFRTVSSVGSRCLDDGGSALPAAMECLRAGYLFAAERHIERLPDSELKTRWLARLRDSRRLDP